MKKVTVAVMVALVGLVFLLPEAEARPEKRFDPGTQTCRVFTFDGNWAGYKTFRNTCKSCHTRNNEQGAPFLYAESKTSAGWNRLFERKSAACASNGAWDKLSRDELLHLNDYLYANGLGTYDARTDCG